MFGHDLSGIWGMTLRHKPDKVETYLSQIPRDLYDIHKFVTLNTDVIFMNSI